MSPLTKSYIASSMLFIVSLFLLSGCGDKNSSANFVTDTGKHVAGWVPFGHKAEATTDSEACKECHGSDLTGGVARVSCSQCHLGGNNAVHPLEWGNFAYARHANYVNQNGTSSCANVYCHGSDLTGVINSGPSCTSCHMGGINSYHPVDWTADSSAHPNYGDLRSCANITCHGAQLQGVAESGPACTACHN